MVGGLYFDAYIAERDAFIADVPTMISGVFFVADVAGGKITGAATIRPGRHHRQGVLRR